jgi:hypothetical protein
MILAIINKNASGATRVSFFFNFDDFLAIRCSTCKSPEGTGISLAIGAWH